MKPYRTMTKVHCISTHRVQPASYGYRKSMCGVTAYCCEDPDNPKTYRDHYGPVPFVSWRKPELVTCKSCQKAMRK